MECSKGTMVLLKAYSEVVSDTRDPAASLKHCFGRISGNGIIGFQELGCYSTMMGLGFLVTSS